MIQLYLINKLKLFAFIVPLLVNGFVYAEIDDQAGNSDSDSEIVSHHDGTAEAKINDNSPDASDVDALGLFLWGHTPSNSVGLGMLSWHITRSHPWDINWNQQMIAINYESYYIATIVNTFDQRGFSVGVRRNVYNIEKDHLKFAVGYNLGILSGYTNGEGMILSKYSPVIPFAQIFTNVTYYDVGVELALIPPLQVLSISGRFIF